MFYPYSKQNINQDDLKAVCDALRSDFLTQGPQLEIFEQKLGAFLSPNCSAIACNNGSSALWLAYKALELGPKAGLITSPITFLATASMAVMLDAPVYFADVDSNTGLMTAETVKQALEDAPFPVKAVTVVHLAGQGGELEAIREVTQKYNCALVEDACHALGATAETRTNTKSYLGSADLSDIAVFSFHAIKHLSMGEGGACITQNPEYKERMISYRNHGMTRNPDDWHHQPEALAPWYYEMSDPSFNLRLTEMQAALGSSQLSRVNTANEKRRKIASWYNQEFSEIDFIHGPQLPPHPNNHAWHLYPIKLDFNEIGLSRGQVMTKLKERGIGTQVHYIPLYRQPWYRKRNYHFLTGAEAYYQDTLSIPMFPQLEMLDISKISSTLKNIKNFF